MTEFSMLSVVEIKAAVGWIKNIWKLLETDK